MQPSMWLGRRPGSGWPGGSHLDERPVDLASILRSAGRRSRDWLRGAAQSLRRWLAERRAARAADIGAPAATPDRDGRLVTIVASFRDDVASILGRIDTAEEIEVVLVVPRAARALRQPAAWAHIAAHVRRRGISLYVVAARGGVRSEARANGLPAARSLRGRRRGRRRFTVGEREFELPGMPWGGLARAGAVLLFVGAAAGVACLTVPSAEIVIVPPSEPMTRTLRVRVNPVAAEPDVEAAVVPGDTARITITTIVSTATSGEADVGDTPAVAELLFTNGGDRPVEVPAATPVSDEGGLAFLTDDALTVPAGDSASVTATAERPGELTNAAADELHNLSGLPETLTVTNPAAATGGANKVVAAVAQEDFDRVRLIADDVLARVGRRELEAVVGEGTFFPQTISVAVFSESALQHLGDPADAFLMEYTAIVTALVLRDDEARRFAEHLLIDALPDGVALLPDTAEAATGGEVEFGAGRLTVDLVATGLVAELFDPSTLRGEVTGVRPETAAARIQQLLSLEEPPVVTLRPEWIPWRWTPRRGSRILIRLAGPTPATEAATGALP